MMTTHNKTLLLLASKLGFSEEERILSKAAEFERLLQTKSTAGSNMTDTSKVVICLDLAASLYSMGFDTKTAIKYSGLKPQMYSNSRKIVENLLELNSEKLSTASLCLTLQCASAQELADRILEEYQKQAKMEVDMHLPQYVCMAIYQACRLSKIKISKSKVIEKSRLKSSQWMKLYAEWTKIVEDKFGTITKKGRPVKKAEINDEIENEEQMDIDQPKDDHTIEPPVEPYEDWKRRVLEAAYKECKELEAKAKMSSPRRSPRKTPQKFSQNTPVNKKGVRLLFAN